MSAQDASDGREVVYRYVDEQDHLLYEKIRRPGKKFAQRRPDPDRTGQRIDDIKGVRRVLYRLPEVVAAGDAGKDVFYVEGEKDADRLCDYGLTATTLGSATSPVPDDFADQLRGIERLLVIPDADEVGRKHALAIATAAIASVGDVRIVDLAVAEHGDVSDFLDDGATIEDLWRRVESAESWSPPAREPEERGGARIGRTRPADALMAWVEGGRSEGSLELFHDGSGETFATMGPPLLSAMRTYPIESKEFRELIESAYLDHSPRSGVIPSQAIKDVVRTCAARARHDGPEHPVFLRVARPGDEVYIDLGNDSGTVEVRGGWWKVVPEAPVRFRRTGAMRPLPVPEAGGDLDMLRRYVNVRDEDLPLVLAWLMSALSGTQPFPVLVIHGEQGSAKSTTAKFLRQLVDPSSADLRALAGTTRDLAVQAHNNHVIGMDNLSGIDSTMSDALCRLSHGEGFGARTHYSDRDETVLAYARPIVITGIECAASRPDLLDRSYIVEAPAISDDERLDIRQVQRDFERDRPQLLGLLLDGVASGLSTHASIEMRSLPRMADAARMAIAAEPGLRLTPGSMSIAIERSRDDARATAIESSPFATSVVEWWAKRTGVPWEGAANDLLKELLDHLGGNGAPRGFPSTPKAVSSQLNRHIASLAHAGIHAEFLGPQRKARTRLWRITAIDDPVSASADAAET